MKYRYSILIVSGVFTIVSLILFLANEMYNFIWLSLAVYFMGITIFLFITEFEERTDVLNEQIETEKEEFFKYTQERIEKDV